LLFTLQKAEPQLALANEGMTLAQAIAKNTLDAFIFELRFILITTIWRRDMADSPRMAADLPIGQSASRLNQERASRPAHEWQGERRQ
jgi:hypothetical protein